MTKQPSPAAARTLAEAEREHIMEVLNQTDWLIGGQDGAATKLGLPRTTLIYKMRKLGIEMRRSHRGRPIRIEQPLFVRAASAGFGSGQFESVAAV